jgi:hypothetical protein
MTRSALALVALPLLAACGGPAPVPQLPPRQPAPPVAVVAPKDLGALGNGDCSTKSFLSQMGCVSIKSHNASSATAAAAAGSATDDDACTVWSSGGLPPQEIGLDIEKEQLVAGVLLVPDMTPPEGDMRHVVQVSRANETFRSVVAVEGRMTSAHGYAVMFPSPVRASGLKVVTESGQTWVAWREIAPVACASN